MRAAAVSAAWQCSCSEVAEAVEAAVVGRAASLAVHSRSPKVAGAEG